MLTVDDVLTSSGQHPKRLEWVSPAVERNAQVVATRINALFVLFGSNRRLTSGFRDVLSNKALRAKGADPYSRHLTGEAADIEDTSGSLKAWLIKHPDAVANVGLWCEPFHLTPTWVHVQITPVPSGLRVSP